MLNCSKPECLRCLKSPRIWGRVSLHTQPRVTSKADAAAWERREQLTQIGDEQRTPLAADAFTVAQTGHKLVLSKANSFELFWANFQPQQALLLLHHLPSELLQLEIIGCGVSITKGYMGSLWRIACLGVHPWRCWAGSTSLRC